MRPTPMLLPALCLALLAAPAAAQDTLVIYRCTDAAGRVTVQNDRPCPKGVRQEVRRVTAAPSAPAASARATAPERAGRPAAATRPPAPARSPAPAAPAAGMPTVPAPTATATATDAPAGTGTGDVVAAPPAPSTDRAPPPALYECRAYDDTRYLSENANPAPRCAPLRTTGLAGGATTGSACEVVTDRCTRVPDAALCDRWRERLRELDTALTFGRVEDDHTARVELDRVRALVTDSACGTP